MDKVVTLQIRAPYPKSVVSRTTFHLCSLEQILTFWLVKQKM